MLKCPLALFCARGFFSYNRKDKGDCSYKLGKLVTNGVDIAYNIVTNCSEVRESGQSIR